MEPDTLLLCVIVLGVSLGYAWVTLWLLRTETRRQADQICLLRRDIDQMTYRIDRIESWPHPTPTLQSGGTRQKKTN